MAAISKSKLGIKCKVYFNQSTYGSPSWFECTSVIDVSVNPTWKEGDDSSRASRVELTAQTMLGLSFDVNCKADDLKTDYVTLWNAMASALDGGIDFLILNGAKDVEGVRGWRAFLGIFGAPEEQSKDGTVSDKFALKPVYNSLGYPKYAVVGGGAAITYTDPGS